MVELYHGARFRKAIDIAEVGAVLSPFLREVELLEDMKEWDPREYERIMSFPENANRSTEEIALEKARIGYQEREFEYRVMNASFARDLEGSRCPYATGIDGNLPGIVFGFETSINIPISKTVFLPKMDLEGNLRKVYVFNCSADQIDYIGDATGRFHPEVLIEQERSFVKRKDILC